MCELVIPARCMIRARLRRRPSTDSSHPVSTTTQAAAIDHHIRTTPLCESFSTTVGFGHDCSKWQWRWETGTATVTKNRGRPPGCDAWSFQGLVTAEGGAPRSAGRETAPARKNPARACSQLSQVCACVRVCVRRSIVGNSGTKTQWCCWFAPSTL